jgi:hypothetical protein
MLDGGIGSGRRKQYRRTVAERAAIVVETYGPGVTVTEVAHRHGIVASQLSTWLTAARRKSSHDSGPALPIYPCWLMRFPRRLTASRFFMALCLSVYLRTRRPSGLLGLPAIWHNRRDLSKPSGSDRDRDQTSRFPQGSRWLGRLGRARTWS